MRHAVAWMLRVDDHPRGHITRATLPVHALCAPASVHRLAQLQCECEDHPRWRGDDAGGGRALGALPCGLAAAPAGGTGGGERVTQRERERERRTRVRGGFAWCAAWFGWREGLW